MNDRLSLSDRQRTTLSTALTILSAAVILGAVAAIVWLLGVFLTRFAGVLAPLFVGAVAALVFKPYFDFLRERLRLPLVLALLAVFLSMVLPLVLFGWFFGALVVEQLTGLARTLPERWQELQAWVTARWPAVQEFLASDPWGQKIEAALEQQQTAVLSGLQAFAIQALSAGAGIMHALAALVGWAVLPIYFAFFLTLDPDRFTDSSKVLPFLKPETRKDVVYLLREFVGILVSFFRGQLIVAFLQGLLFAIGFTVVDLNYGFVLGLALGFLNVIPYLGSVVGLALALPIGYFQEGGGWTTVVWVLAVFAIVQLVEGYVLTPRIMGNRTGLHPMVIIVAIFFWGTALDGILGMILAIPLTAFLVVFWRLARDKYIRELV